MFLGVLVREEGFTNRLLYQLSYLGFVEKKAFVDDPAAGFPQLASCKSLESTMLYLSKVDSVKCPEIFIAILRGTPDRMRFLTPLRRKA